MLRSSLAMMMLAPLMAFGADDDLGKSEREKLQGTWVQVKGFRGSGEELAPWAVKEADARMTISGDTLTNRTRGRRGLTYKFTLDTSRDPRAIDWVIREGADPRPGIYRVDGETLEVAFSAGGSQERPTALTPCPKDSKSKWTFATYRRETGPDIQTPEQAAAAAEAGLEATRPLAVGREAPDIDGVDLDGKPLKLSDYKGKVVVLVFWGSWCLPCVGEVPHQRSLVERYEGKPFALLGVDCNEEKATALETVQKLGINWASWHDGEEIGGPIAVRYHVHSFPSVFVLDAKGIIRARDVRGPELDRALDSLMKEFEQLDP